MEIYIDDVLLAPPLACVKTAESAVWEPQYSLNTPIHTDSHNQGCEALISTACQLWKHRSDTLIFPPLQFRRYLLLPPVLESNKTK